MRAVSRTTHGESPPEHDPTGTDTHTVPAPVDRVMSGRLPEAVERFVRLNGPEPHPVQEEMREYGREEGFPIIGPEVGGLLSAFVRMVGAERVFELGSGFGYSASWLAGALPADGHIALTEFDGDELDMAREFFERLGYADRATFERGDALEIVERYDGPVDVVRMDQEKN
jgi:predicted O-methyltransferase YrrM